MFPQPQKQRQWHTMPTVNGCTIVYAPDAQRFLLFSPIEEGEAEAVRAPELDESDARQLYESLGAFLDQFPGGRAGRSG